MKQNKAQAALEGIMVYGWALAAIVIVIITLVVLVNPTNIETENCIGFENLLIKNWKSSTLDLNLLLINKTGKNIDGFSIDLNGTIVSRQVNKTKNFIGIFKASDSNILTLRHSGALAGTEIGDKYDFKLQLTYFDDKGFERTEKGQCRGLIGGIGKQTQNKNITSESLG